MEQITYFAIVIGAIFVNNVVLAQFLGICPFLGVSSKVETSMGMGAAVTFVMALTALVAWSIQTYILDPLQIQYMQTIVFILVFALALVLFAGIRERLELEDVPESFRGTPIALVTAGILAMAFMGFSGLV